MQQTCHKQPAGVRWDVFLLVAHPLSANSFRFLFLVATTKPCRHRALTAVQPLAASTLWDSPARDHCRQGQQQELLGTATA